MIFRFWLIILILLANNLPAKQATELQLPATVYITEFLYDAVGPDNQEEWVEIANLGPQPVDLSRYKLGDEESPGGGEGMTRFPTAAVLNPGAVIVVAQTAVGFQRRTGRLPDYEWQDSDSLVPDMRRFSVWSEGEIALANDGDELLLLNERGRIVDAVNYGSSTTFFLPAIDPVPAGQSIARPAPACDTDSAADWQAQPLPTPGTLPTGDTCPLPAASKLPPIGALQGSGPIAAMIDQQVVFRGVVTTILADQNAAGTTYYTVFVQDAAGQEDGDSATSDGVALFSGRQRPRVRPGDQLRVSGRVTEFYGLTEIDDAGVEIIVEKSEQPLPQPLPITLSAPGDAAGDFFEQWESMRVLLPGPAVVVGPTYSGCGFAVMSGTDLASRPLRRHSGDPATHLLPVLHTNDSNCAGFPEVKAGDVLTDLVGTLTYHFDQYKLVLEPNPVRAIETAALAPIPEPPVIGAGMISVATFNMENHFDEIDDTGSDAEPKPGPAEIADRQQKLAYAISTTLGCPAIIGVQEVEKAALLTALADLLLESCGFRYQVTHDESADVRGIDVALMTDPSQIQVTDSWLRQGCTLINTGIVDEISGCPSGKWPLFSRPPLQVDLVVNGRSLTIFVNHFKSKRGGEIETAPRRLAQAAQINDLVTPLLAADPEAAVIVLGDFNDYEGSPALQQLSTQLTNVLNRVPAQTRYSFVFGGVAQLLDGVLLSPALLTRVQVAMIFHVNADFPAAWRTDTSPTRIAYRSTDHDLPLVLIDLPGVDAKNRESALITPSPATAPTAAGQSVSSQPLWEWWLLLGAAMALALLGWLDRRMPGK